MEAHSVSTEREPNATFHAFRTSGKWYTTGRGYLSPGVFAVFERHERREQIVADNGGRYPGLSGPGNDFIFVVVGDDSCDHGFPLLLYPTNQLQYGA